METNHLVKWYPYCLRNSRCDQVHCYQVSHWIKGKKQTPETLPSSCSKNLQSPILQEYKQMKTQTSTRLGSTYLLNSQNHLRSLKNKSFVNNSDSKMKVTRSGKSLVKKKHRKTCRGVSVYRCVDQLLRSNIYVVMYWTVSKRRSYLWHDCIPFISHVW